MTLSTKSENNLWLYLEKKVLLGKFYSEKQTIGTILTTSGFRGWGRGADAPFSGIRPLADAFFKELRKKMGLNGLYSDLGELRKSICSTYKKKVDKVFEFI